MTLHAALLSEQVGLGSTVPHGCQSWAQCRAQRLVTPTPSCPGWQCTDATSVSSGTLLHCAVARLTLWEWLSASVGCDAPSGRSFKAATGLMPSRPRARRRIGTSSEAFRVGPRARRRVGTSSEALRRGPRANRRIGRGLVIVSWLRYLQGLSKFFRFLLRIPLFMVSDRIQ